MRYSSYSLSTSALDKGKWSASRSGRFIPEERIPSTDCTGGWVGPRAGLDTEAIWKILSSLPRIEPQSPGRSARSQALYWHSYPAHVPYTTERKACALPTIKTPRRNLLSIISQTFKQRRPVPKHGVKISRFSGVMVSVFATGPKARGSKPGQRR
jgi:hypothetical protein